MWCTLAAKGRLCLLGYFRERQSMDGIHLFLYPASPWMPYSTHPLLELDLARSEVAYSTHPLQELELARSEVAWNFFWKLDWSRQRSWFRSTLLNLKRVMTASTAVLHKSWEFPFRRQALLCVWLVFINAKWQPKFTAAALDSIAHIKSMLVMLLECLDLKGKKFSSSTSAN